MKKLLLTIISAFTFIVAYSQQPTEPVVQPSQITAYGDTVYYGEDNVKTGVFEYGDDGTLINYYKHTVVGEQWADTVHIQYDDRNNVTILDWWYYDSPSSWFWSQHRKQNTYDGKNRLVEVMTTTLDASNRPLARWVPEYDEEDRIVQDSYYCWYYPEVGSPIVYLQQQRNTTYGDTQNVTVIERWDKDGNAKKFRITENFTSDGRTQSVMWERFGYTIGAYVNKTLSNRIYSDGRLAEVEEEVWNSDNNSWVHDRKTMYTRDANGRIAMTEYKLWNGVMFSHYKRTLYERNELGYPTTMLFQDYSYDNNGWDDGSSMIDVGYYGNDYVNYPIPNYGRDRLIDSVFTDDHLRMIDNMFVISFNVRKLEFSYTETPNPHYAVDEVVVKPLTIFPNPANESLNIEFSPDMNCRSVEIYSIDGRLVETFPETSTSTSHPTTIDISNLTHGMYILKVKTTDGKEFTEKIVKK